jgi:hypothetical protein
LDRDSNTITVAEFYENFRLNKYNFDPPYQRKSVWTDEKQSFFVDSVLKNFPIPPIFLRQHIDDETGKTKYDVIDGKQRLLSLIRFIQDEIPVTTEFEDPFYDEMLAGALFSDLDKKALASYKRRFWRYVIPIEYIDTTSEEVIDSIFDRLNRNGEPLTGQELRNAKYHDSKFLQLVWKLTNTPFWSERLEHVDLARMEDQEFISELLFVLLEGGPLGADSQILDKLYENYAYASLSWDELEDRFRSVTKFLEELGLDYESFRIKGVSHLYGLWCFAWLCQERMDLTPSPVAPCIKTFFSLRENNPEEDVMLAYRQYKISMSARTKSKSMRSRRLNALASACGLPGVWQPL